MPRIEPHTLEEFVARLFAAYGASPEDAQVVATHLVQSNLAGHDSHGVLRVPQYIQAMQQGDVQVQRRPHVVRQFESGAVIDGQQCFGQVAAVQGMSLAIELARRTGVAAVTVTNVYHSGRLGAYTEQAAAEGLIGIVMVNASGGGQSVTPFGGRARRLATNPLSIAAPWKDHFPIVIDMATSVAPEGKIRLYKQLGRSLPAGWIVNAHGEPSTRPDDFYADPPGAILPLGGDVGYKGFGLAVMVELLTGALSGGGVCHEHTVAASDNMLMLAIDVERFAGGEIFQQHVSTLIRYIQSTPTAPGFSQVFAPGEIEQRARVERSTHGIDVDPETWQSLLSLASDKQIEAASTRS